MKLLILALFVLLAPQASANAAAVIGVSITTQIAGECLNIDCKNISASLQDEMSAENLQTSKSDSSTDQINSTENKSLAEDNK